MIHEGIIGRGFKEELEKQSKAWVIHMEHRQLISEEDTFFWLM
jgi:hypothetical protein